MKLDQGTRLHVLSALVSKMDVQRRPLNNPPQLTLDKAPVRLSQNLDYRRHSACLSVELKPSSERHAIYSPGSARRIRRRKNFLHLAC